METMTGQANAPQSQIKVTADKLIANVSNVIIGKKDVTELVMVALLCEGHVLLEDVPGVGKTLLAKAISRSLGCSFQRIQCTPDLLPSDVTGIQFYNQKTGSFEFHPGPMITNVLLVDEINRATPRTQSCFLESMQEQQITVDTETIHLPRPFLIIATQNPIELEGTFPLPEAQLDRFLVRLKIGYPSEDEEGAILSRFQDHNPLEDLNALIESKELLELQKLSRQVFVEESVRNYLVAISWATRRHTDIKLGASPRASLGLHHAAQALAAIRGRNYVIPDDIKYLAMPTLAHRLILKAESRLRNRRPEDVVQEIVKTLPVPVERAQ